MGEYVEITTQAELDRLKPGDIAVVRSGHFTASGSATVTAYDSATVTASGSVPVHRFGDGPKVKGGVLLQVPDLDTCAPEVWADYSGVTVTKAGYATVYAAVDGEFWKGHGYIPTRYAPGDKPTAEDWKPSRRCGSGLHFGATPHHARRYNTDAKRYVACRIKLADAVPLGDKIKAESCTVLYEVDIDGERVDR